ncbi:hypothetical protein [Micromonospora sp. MH99]|uniref:hypothetical protein n=1 Tax=Micromonospora sp. MH99 TaxID=1945510 RepID=UPI001F40F13C|nr:hypothetical protein [Micromonospora sp. MH99]MCF0092307.1 hypothetical protein [Micromonospora sp. MH99]
MDVVTTDERRPPTTDSSPDEIPSAPDSRARRLLASARYALPALGAYAAVRVLGGLTLYLWASPSRSTEGLLTRADGNWYLAISQHGYDGYQQLQSNMAFFPLYPGLTAALEPLTPLDFRKTALALAWIAALAAAWGLFAVGNLLHGRRVGIMLAVLWGLLPHSIVQTMSYSEGLFTALAAWTLYALLRERWLTAGALCLFAGLTRPTASALIAVVGLAALIAAFRRRDGWRPWVAMVLAPAGWVGYLAWVGVQTGRPDGWFHIQDAGWGTTFDFGVDTLRRGRTVLTEASALEFYTVTLVAVLAITLFVLSLIDRQPWQLLLYSGLLLVTTLGAAGYYHSKARFLLPAFPLLIPVAVAFAKAARARAVAILTLLALMSAYFGGYLLIVWRSSP